VLLSISKIFTENKVDVKTMNVRTSKNGTATVSVSFDIGGKEQLLTLISKLRTADNVIDIERSRG
jgi:GTP pyrophosphokinase